MRLFFLLFLFLPNLLFAQPASPSEKFPEFAKVEKLERQQGFVSYYYDNDTGKLWLSFPEGLKELLYIESLVAGVGSNDLGLDRGQMGNAQLVELVKRGDKLLMIEQNTRYRANSDNPLEAASVEEAFAKSVLWGLK